MQKLILKKINNSYTLDYFPSPNTFVHRINSCENKITVNTNTLVLRKLLVSDKEDDNSEYIWRHMDDAVIKRIVTIPEIPHTVICDKNDWLRKRMCWHWEDLCSIHETVARNSE